MGYYNFPHTRNYDTDLGYLIDWFKTNKNKIEENTAITIEKALSATEDAIKAYNSATSASNSAELALELKNQTEALKNLMQDKIEQIDTNTNRINNLATIDPGSVTTTGDAELVDIRVGVNGITYPSAGDAVRGQVSELKSDISDITPLRTSQLLDAENVEVHKWFLDSVARNINSNDGCRLVFVDISNHVGETLQIHKDIASRFTIATFEQKDPQLKTVFKRFFNLDSSSKLASIKIEENENTIAIWYYFNEQDVATPEDILKSIMVNYGRFNRYEPYKAVYGYNEIPTYVNKNPLNFNDKIFINNIKCWMTSNDGELINSPFNIQDHFYVEFKIFHNTDTVRYIWQIAYTQLGNLFARYLIWDNKTNEYTKIYDWKGLSDKYVITHNEMYVVGDSITAGHPSYIVGEHWWECVGRNLGFNVTAGGRSGSGMSYYNGTNACKIAKNTDFKNYNVAVFAFGTNDYGNDISLGTFEDEYTYSEDSSQTFYSAVKYVIKTVKTSNPKCTLILSLPINRTKRTIADNVTGSENCGNIDTKWAYGYVNNAGYTLNDYCEAIIKCCNYYGIPYIDNRNGSFDSYSLNTLLVDGLHPTEEGYKILGMDMSAKINSIIMHYAEYDGVGGVGEW